MHDVLDARYIIRLHSVQTPANQVAMSAVSARPTDQSSSVALSPLSHDRREDDAVNPDKTLQQHDLTTVSPLPDDPHFQPDTGELPQRSGGRGGPVSSAGADKSLDFSLSSNDDESDHERAATGRSSSLPTKEGKLAEASKALDERVNDFSERMHHLIAKFQPGTSQKIDLACHCALFDCLALRVDRCVSRCVAFCCGRGRR